MMKKLFAMLMVYLLLTVPAMAEELYTFAGVKLDTPVSECEAALEKATGAGFTLIDDGYTRCVVIDPGYYSVLGLPIEATGYYDGIVAYYNKTAAAWNGEVQPEDDAAWVLSSIYCEHSHAQLDAEGLELIGAVIGNVTRKYGEPTMVLLGEEDDNVYIVRQEEYPYILRDGFAFAAEQDWDEFEMVMAFRNVCVILVVEMPRQSDDGVGRYDLMLGYMPAAITEDLLVTEENAPKPFPWVNGEPEYFVIEP